jgi:cysteine desulfurase / selenocysteine lyase
MMSVGREASPSFIVRLGDRSIFPDLAPRAYLNHGGISPTSLAVRRAVNVLMEDYGCRGAGAYPTWSEQRTRLKSKLGALIGAEAEDIVIAPNTTQGIAMIALCFPWKPGDRVVVFEGEFPSNVTPWQRAAALFDVDVTMLPLTPFATSAEAGLEMLSRELSLGVRLVAVSAVQFQSGLRMPLAAMAERCHAHGAELFVDGVQACGAVPLDVRAAHLDYLACGSHKWLMGLEGAGFLYVHPARAGTLRPHFAGWLSHEECFRFLFEGEGHLRYDRPIRRSADFLEIGNCNGAGLAGLEASVDLILSLGVAEIHAHVNGYLDALEDGLLMRGFTSLRAREPERRSCILGVLPPASRGVTTVALYPELSARGVVCATPDGVLRFTPHWPNALEEVPFVLSMVDEGVAALAGR